MPYTKETNITIDTTIRMCVVMPYAKLVICSNIKFAFSKSAYGASHIIVVNNIKRLTKASIPNTINDVVVIGYDIVETLETLFDRDVRKCINPPSEKIELIDAEELKIHTENLELMIIYSPQTFDEAGSDVNDLRELIKPI